MKKLTLKLSPALLVAVVVGVVAVFGGVKAYQSYGAASKIGQVINYYEGPQTVSEAAPEELLGAVVSPDNLPAQLCSNDVCTYTAVQTFINASTTIVSIPSPFLKATTTGSSEVVIFTDDGGKKYTSATATIDLASLQITGPATTSYSVACAATAGPTPALPLHNPLVTTSVFAVATSSVGTIENNLRANEGGLVDGGTIEKALISSDKPYFTCVVAPSVAAGFTNALNTFDGKAVVRFRQIRL